MLDPSQLDYSERNGILAADLGLAGCAARVVKYAAGDSIPMHFHTHENVKFLLKGAIEFESPDGPLGLLLDGEIYWCGGVGSPYRGRVLRDSYLLIVEDAAGKRVNVA
jgi:hypothetical protein